MSTNILIVDSDKGFSTILTEGLNTHPDFKAVASHSGTRALKYMTEKPVDLVIIDMGISDIPPVKMVEVIKANTTDVAIMIVPLMGQEAPEAVKKLGINGVIPKPFFVGDLPKLVGQALGLDIPGEEPEDPKPQPKDLHI